MENNQAHKESESMDDDHTTSNNETPMRADAFVMSDDEKVNQIEKHFREIMHILGLDLEDDSLKGSPRRVAKMYVKDMFWGLNPDSKPSISHFKNKFKYNDMLIEKDIAFYTNCEHHFVPFFGKAHIAYIPNGKVIGLSKLNRVVEYYAKRPQVQERLTMQIANELKEILNTEDVAVIINAKHLCVASRGIKDNSSNTTTAEYGGKFAEKEIKNEFHTLLGL